MAEKILMPRLSDTMTEGVIAEWHKKVGDPVKKGDLLAEIETDKATMELESYKDGTVLYLGTEKGGKLKVDDLMVIVGDAGEDITALLGTTAATTEKPKQEKPATAVAEKPADNTDYSKLEEVVLMPRLSDTMTEGVIASWAKNVGDDIKKGDLLAEIETDKATMELESYKNGKLLYQGAKKGEKIKVNDLLAIIGAEGSVDVPTVVAALSGSAPAIIEAKEEIVVEEPAIEQPQETTTGEIAANDENGRIKASPLAKRLAEEKGLDLSKIQGSGDGGRIIKADVDTYKAPVAEVAKPAAAKAETPSAVVATASAATNNQSQPVSSPNPVAASVGAQSAAYIEIAVSQMRKTIARRLAESKFTAPHFYLTMSIDMDNAVASRTKINEGGSVKISFNDLVLKACAIALKQHPAVNSSWMGDIIRFNNNINIGVAVAVEEGLLVPVVRNADAKSLSQISTEVKDFAQKAKDKKLQPSDWEGNTFTISNLGMFGIDEFTAIINPPDACILAVGGIAQVPVVKNGNIVVGNVMKVTLSCDHRVVDGAKGAAFLQTLKNLLEEPLRMLV